MICWLGELDPGKDWTWPKQSLLPRECQWKLKGKEANIHRQNRVLQFMGAGCPGISTRNTWRTEKKDSLGAATTLKHSRQSHFYIEQQHLSSSTHRADTYLEPTPAFRCLLFKALEPLFCIIKNPGVMPRVTETTYMGWATASALFSLVVFMSLWKNGHPQLSLRDYAAHHSC